jgi:hypothetical protein
MHQNCARNYLTKMMPSDAILNLSSMQRSVDVPKALSPSLYISYNIKCIMLNFAAVRDKKDIVGNKWFTLNSCFPNETNPLDRTFLFLR